MFVTCLLHPKYEVRPAGDRWHWWNGALDLADVACEDDPKGHNFVVQIPFKFEYEDGTKFYPNQKSYSVLYQYVAFDEMLEPTQVFVVAK